MWYTLLEVGVFNPELTADEVTAVLFAIGAIDSSWAAKDELMAITEDAGEEETITLVNDLAISTISLFLVNNSLAEAMQKAEDWNVI